MYKECLHNLRPKLKLFKSYEKAQEEIEKLRQQLYPNLGEGGSESDGKLLGTIMENESDYTSEAIAESDDEIKKPRSEMDEFNDGDAENDDYNEELDDGKSKADKNDKTEDDLQFEAMFDKMSADSYQERIKELQKVTTRDIPVPMSTKAVKKTYEQLQVTF